MDNQDPRKINASGHENHGVHVCHKCGWPFPNPHPSAKHRRAHKRICGTVEGYKLIDSEENTHLTFSDDEPLSDEDHKSPSPKIVKRSSGSFGGRSNRSDYEVFSDAVAEFSDTGSSPGVTELLEDAREPVSNVEKIVKDDPSITQSIKDSAITEIIRPPNSSTDSSKMQNSEVLESTSNQLGSTTLPQDRVPSSTIGSIVSSISDSGTKESSVVLSDNKNGSSCDLNPIKAGPSTDAPQENKKTNAGEDFMECSSSFIGIESDAKGNEVNNLEENLLDIAVSPSENARETSEAGSKLEEMNGNISDPITADGTFLSKEEQSDGLGPKMPPSVLSPEVESVLHVETFCDTAQVQVDTSQCLDFASSGDIIEGCNTKVEGNKNVHVLSVPDDIPVVDYPEIMVEDFKDNKALKLNLPVTLDSCEAIRDKEDDVGDPVSEENCSSFQSRQSTEGIGFSCSDMHALEDKVNQEGGSSGLMVEEVPVEREAYEIKGTINENFISDELGAPADAAKIEIEKSQTVCSPEEEESQDFCNDLSKKILPENVTMVPSNVNPLVSPMDAEVNQTTNLVGGDDAGGHEKARTEKCDITGDDCREGATEENHTENTKTTPESANNLCESQINQMTNLLGGDDVGDHERVEIKMRDIAGNGSTEGSMEENLKTKTTPESANNLCESQINQMTNLLGGDDVGDHERVEIKKRDIAGNGSTEGSMEENLKTKTTPESAGSLSEFQVAEDGMDRYVSNLPETKSTHLDRVSDSNRVGIDASHLAEAHTSLKNCLDEDSREGVEELEISSSNKVQVEFVGAVGTVAESNHGGDVELLQKTSEDQMPREPLLSAVDAKSSDQSSVAVEDEHSKVLGHGASGIGSESLQEEGDNNLSKQQIGVSAVDSSSQTDSLEGNWGSVSDATVLSIQSEAPAVVDAKSSVQSSVTVEDEHSRVLGQGASGIGSESLQEEGDNNLSKQQIGVSAVDSSSQTDSLEGNWGSVSDATVLSIQSEAPAVVDAKSSVQSSVTVEDEHSRVLGQGASGIGSESLQEEGDNNLSKQQIGVSAVDISAVDSSSQTDSLEGNWGSVSDATVFSIQSEAPTAVVDAEALPSTDSQISAKPEKAVLKKPKDASEGHSDKSDIFDPPSFMTLVEPGGDQKATDSEIQTVQNPQQQNSASLQAGWFPSLTHVVNDSQGRKKNEEIIAKVTNWSTGKQHTPLKSLLGEANLEMKPKSPNPKENPTPMVQKDGNPTKNNGALATTVNSNPGPEASIAQAAKEWNSPARYPTDIKREKRKVKGKPYWVQFVCCSSVN